MGRSRLVVGWGLGQKLLPLLQPGQEAPIELPIAQQGEEGWGKAQGESGPLVAVSRRRFQHRQQGQIALLKGLEVPVFFERTGFAAAHVGQVRVQHDREVSQGQIACGHGHPALCPL